MIDDAYRVAAYDMDKAEEAVLQLQRSVDFWRGFLESIYEKDVNDTPFNLSEFNALFSLSNDAVKAAENLDTLSVAYRRYAMSPNRIPSLSRA